MTAARATFVVEVHEDGGAVIENAVTHESVWLSQLSQIAVQIADWLAEREAETPGGPPHVS